MEPVLPFAPDLSGSAGHLAAVEPDTVRPIGGEQRDPSRSTKRLLLPIAKAGATQT